MDNLRKQIERRRQKMRANSNLSTPGSPQNMLSPPLGFAPPPPPPPPPVRMAALPTVSRGMPTGLLSNLTNPDGATGRLRKTKRNNRKNVRKTKTNRSRNSPKTQNRAPKAQVATVPLGFLNNLQRRIAEVKGNSTPMPVRHISPKRALPVRTMVPVSHMSSAHRGNTGSVVPVLPRMRPVIPPKPQFVLRQNSNNNYFTAGEEFNNNSDNEEFFNAQEPRMSPRRSPRMSPRRSPRMSPKRVTPPPATRPRRSARVRSRVDYSNKGQRAANNGTGRRYAGRR